MTRRTLRWDGTDRKIGKEVPIDRQNVSMARGKESLKIQTLPMVPEDGVPEPYHDLRLLDVLGLFQKSSGTAAAGAVAENHQVDNGL